MSKTIVEPYLFFGGRCDEALAFYQQALGAEVEMLMRYKDSPDPVPEGLLQPGFEDKVMHVSFRIGDARVMASDGCTEKDSGLHGFSLSLTLADEKAANKAFDALSQGGQVGMPLTKTFWSPCFGMVTDKFGVGWMVTVAGAPAS